MGWSLVGLVDRPQGQARGQAQGERRPQEFPPVMLQARSRVLKATKAAKIFFLNSVNELDVEDQIKEGVMIGAGGPAAAEKGRKFTKRAMPY
jgi:hypothetical protein